MRTFTRQQLRLYNGEDRPARYIAYQGMVYDVSECPKWRAGLHEGLHWPGLDLTDNLQDAPHAAEVFARPCVKVIARLI